MLLKGLEKLEGIEECHGFYSKIFLLENERKLKKLEIMKRTTNNIKLDIINKKIDFLLSQLVNDSKNDNYYNNENIDKLIDDNLIRLYNYRNELVILNS